MAELDQVSDQIKETLIDEYLEKNPGVARSEVVTRMQNGRLVFDTIKNVVGNVSSLKAAEAEKELLKKQLQIKEDERYQACQASIQTCKRIVNSLFTTKAGDFGIIEKNDQLKFLRRQEKTIVSLAYDVHQVKGEFLEMTAGKVNPTHSRTRTLTNQYLKSVLDQLKSQQSIYAREYELGSKFSRRTSEYIKEHIPDVKGQLPLATRKRIAQAFALAKKVAGQNAPQPSEITREALEEALAEMDSGLDQRRVQIGAIEKVIALVEAIVKELEEQEAGKGADQDADKPKSKKKGKGMAFFSKLIGR